MGKEEIYEFLKSKPNQSFNAFDLAKHFNQNRSNIRKHVSKMEKQPNYYTGLKFHRIRTGDYNTFRKYVTYFK